MIRGTSSRLWERTVDLVLSAAEHRFSRADLAARWRTTPRTVSNVLTHARETYLVDIETGRRVATGQAGRIGWSDPAGTLPEVTWDA